MANFTPERSAAIRANLINHVAENPPPRRRRALWASGFVVAGLLIGAGASAGAFAATGMLTPTPAQPSGQPTPAYPDAVAAPPGVTPGAPIIALLGDPITQTFDTTTQISLEDRPAAATHARVAIMPLTPGALNWGTDPGGNNPNGGWDAQYLASGVDPSTRYDFPLDDTVHTLYLNPTDFSAVVTVQFITQIPTRLGINANGQTYGVAGSIEGSPDLVSVGGVAPDGTQVNGYVRDSELNASSPDHPGLPSSPDEALRWQEETQQKYPNGWTIPVYTSDGTTQIGTFHIGG